jgi:hypothetical protein
MTGRWIQLLSFNPRAKSNSDLLTDFPVQSVGEGNSKIIIEQAGFLHVYDIGQGILNRQNNCSADLSNLHF